MRNLGVARNRSGRRAFRKGHDGTVPGTQCLVEPVQAGKGDRRGKGIVQADVLPSGSVRRSTGDRVEGGQGPESGAGILEDAAGKHIGKEKDFRRHAALLQFRAEGVGKGIETGGILRETGCRDSHQQADEDRLMENVCQILTFCGAKVLFFVGVYYVSLSLLHKTQTNMKRILPLLAALLPMSCCTPSADVPFTEVKNYFFRNDAVAPQQPVIETEEAFEQLFGAAAVMGKDGQPTAVDFGREFVIAAVLPETDRLTQLEPVSLKKEGGEFVFTCRETVGERQSWTLRPCLLVKVDRKYAGTPVRLEKEVVDTPTDPASYQSFNQEHMQTVRDFLHKTGFYFLATVDGDQPQVRPFGTAEIIEGKLYIQTGHVKNVARQIAANPKVAICAYDGERWLRITATLVEDPRVEIKKAMLDANPNLRSMYDEHDDNTAVYFLKDARATFSSFTSEPVQVDF